MNTNLSIKDYMAQPLVTRMSVKENDVREYVMRNIVQHHMPYKVAFSPDAEILRDLASRHLLSLVDDEVVAAYPVSAKATNKRVIFSDGREAYAMCALDAMGFHYAFGEDVRIESECEECGEEIVLQMRSGKVNVVRGGAYIHILHTDLQNIPNWACNCCTMMHFFSCVESLEHWREKNVEQQKTFALDLETANKMAWLLFAR